MDENTEEENDVDVSSDYCYLIYAKAECTNELQTIRDEAELDGTESSQTIGNTQVADVTDVSSYIVNLCQG